MDIRQIIEFLTVSELENMSRAAEYLKISQPALSKSMNRLETELGVSLFQRTGRKISVNDAGLRFRKTCERILAEWNQCREDLSLMNDGSASVIRIGTFGPCDAMLRCMTEFEHNTGLHAEFQVSTMADREPQIDIKQYDVLVYPSDAKYEFFHGFPFYLEEYLVAVPEEHPFNREAVITPKMLAEQSFVWLHGSGEGADYPKRICESMMLPVRTAAIVDSREVQRRMVQEGIGCAILPKGACALFSENSSIALVPILDRRFTRQMNVCFRREKYLSVTARRFRDYLIEILGISEGRNRNKEKEVGHD